ncbi:MAG: glycosyltransferase family 2 protein [Prevotella sp.]|nr:glycosyltransferase family 2 protein [Prevotella sp.]
MEKSLVSVIIPSHGGGQYLERAVDSVLSQTYPNIEIIVVDDNGIGTPNQLSTQQIMQKYCSNEKVKYVCHKVNKNGSIARNTGFKHSSGKYIALLDDDDEYLPKKIERQVKLLDSLSQEYAFVYCSHDVYKDDRLVRHVTAEKSGDLFFEKISHEIEIQTSGVLIKRDIFDKIEGFDESFQRHQDWEFIERVLFQYKAQADNFIGYNRYLYFRSDSKSPNQAKEWREHYLKKMKPYIDTLPPYQANIVYRKNNIDIILQYLKAKDYSGFTKEIFTSKIGLKGFANLAKRLVMATLKGGPVKEV